ncbi:uncharacterized protein LOC121376049 [Gigantopelta aegis]|uniref:uncharacterized protein LOC121376049 n=1 Tax=Gigantopelta aegis TaxID=1735272 RepID=UPI001B88972A|nr:uncharacterized protein LOC121376049 [Gigantopelta aegis]
MPSNEDFTFNLTVGGVKLPEYEKDGSCYVESCLFTPYSYNMTVEEQVGDEKEVQSWPVTPYQLKIMANPSSPRCYYRVFVDGHHVKSCSIRPGETRVITGFRDGNLLKEFLFSLPRFPKDEQDRIDSEKCPKVGTVEVLCFNARLKNTKMTIRTRRLRYLQANKKDSAAVTQGKYGMITTKAGRTIREKSSRKRTDFWQILDLRKGLAVKYVTKDTIKEMGFDVRQVPFINHTEQIGSYWRSNQHSTQTRNQQHLSESKPGTSDLKNEHSEVIDLQDIKVETEPVVVQSSTEIIVID